MLLSKIDDGWLLEVQVASDAYRRNLLSGRLAEEWMDEAHQAPRAQALDQLLTSMHSSYVVRSFVRAFPAAR